jgi:Zn-dependent protease with chaperone function
VSRKSASSSSVVVASVLLLCVDAGAEEVSLDGYLEWRQGPLLIVDGQAVEPSPDASYRGAGHASAAETIPLGYECKLEGERRPDGVIVARKLEAKPNGDALFEGEIRAASDEAEALWRRVGRIVEYDESGAVESLGRLLESGPQVERVRTILSALSPPYLQEEVRVYVVENGEWNAMAMGNYSIYVFTGLLESLDDDELAIVLGHELVHATHEHARRHLKKDFWIQLGAVGAASVAEETIDNGVAREATKLVSALFAVAWSSGYGRRFEDQADRVGLRYAYEAGYDVRKAPHLWERFAEKYGQPGKVVNFFFGNHSLATKRAEHLHRELVANYPDGPRTGDTPRWAAEARSGVDTAAAHIDTTEPGGRSALRTALHPGMTADEIRSLLGDPEEIVAFANVERWRYAELGLILEHGRLRDVRF